jgi:hypothetical protein
MAWLMLASGAVYPSKVVRLHTMIEDPGTTQRSQHIPLRITTQPRQEIPQQRSRIRCYLPTRTRA